MDYFLTQLSGLQTEQVTFSQYRQNYKYSEYLSMRFIIKTCKYQAILKPSLLIRIKHQKRSV